MGIEQIDSSLLAFTRGVGATWMCCRRQSLRIDIRRRLLLLRALVELCSLQVKLTKGELRGDSDKV